MNGFSAPHPRDQDDSVVEIDLGGEYLRQNFMRILSEWAKNPPIYVRSNEEYHVVCSRYSDVMEVFRDRERFSVEPPERKPGAFDRFLGLESLAQLDGSRHDRLRRLLAPTFNPGSAQRQLGLIEAVVEGLIDAMPIKQGRIEIMGDFAMHLVVRVLLGGMLKMTETEIGAFVAAGEAIGAVSQLKRDDAVPQKLFGAFGSARVIVEELIKKRRADPGDDLISILISARDGGDSLSDTELFDQIFIICAAALTTTAGSLGGLLLCLGRNPDQFSELKQNPALVSAVVEEGLRVHGPGYLAFARFARMDTIVGGTAIPEGTAVYCSMQAACYDPIVFPNPLRFDIHRKPRNIPIFGSGVHHCLGQNLARLILQVSLRQLVERFPDLSLADANFEPEYHGEFGESLLTRLPMSVG